MNCLDGFISISPSRGGLVLVPAALEPSLPLALTHDRPEVSNPHQVVGGRGKGEHPSYPSQATMSRLAHQPYGLDPAEDLFHPFALALAEGVARVPRRTAIDRT